MAFRVRHYPHNDLLNLAHYHREVINSKVAQDSVDGLALDCTSCLIALAFGVEALINFVGARKVTDWNEGAKSPLKLRAVTKQLGIAMQPTQEPFATLGMLRQVRNGLAHGKPVEKTAQATSREQLQAATQAPWQPYLQPEIVNAAFEQVVAFRRMLFERAGIRWVDTLTSAFGGY